MTDHSYLSASQLVRGYRDGTLDPVAATEHALQRIDAVDPAVNAFCVVDRENALREAHASRARWADGSPRGPIDGVPTSVKDVIGMKGLPLRKGSRASEDTPWPEDGPAVSRLRESGAVIIGKTTTPENGWKGVTDSLLTGITRNPWRPDLTPGGSSGGAAAALALDMGALAVGTDGGGSVRIPAAYCGVAALKTTFGRVSTWPGGPLECLPIHGPMARRVADIALLLDVIGQPDSRDPNCLPAPLKSFSSEVADRGADLSGLRIAFSVDLGYVDIDPEIGAIVTDAITDFEKCGATVIDAHPGFTDPVDDFHTIWFAAAAKMVDNVAEERRHLLDPGLREIGALGADMSALDYVTAMARRAELGNLMGQFHDEYDLLVTPTMPRAPFAAGHEVPPEMAGSRWTKWTPFTYPFNLTQQPAASVPCGLTANGLPVGLQIVGARFADATVLQAAHAFEKVAGSFLEWSDHGARLAVQAQDTSPATTGN
ncbi:amidase [Mycolicibacterium sp. HK-90]|uniref:amidase n=1 Tax=Mycolicibacterium sp. HK-90 TaxID=3056937 RepID=UPI0026592A98|nr:amidase [Mycolicibacterium sp. HK-90]WKG03967.1 amidase [Mycolicibacterium sp. HK-90]